MKRMLILLVGTAVLVAGAAIPAVSATKTPTGQWTHATGTLTIDADLLDEVTVDTVEVFTAPDGRYRVTVEATDGTGEEIAFDGHVKTMLITGPGGSQKAALIDSSANFAVMSPDYAKAQGYDVVALVNGRVTHWVKETEHARVEFLLGSVNEIAADETKVTIEIPDGVEVPDEVINLDEELKPGQPVALPGTLGASASLVSLFDFNTTYTYLVDIYYYNLCVTGANFRNNVSEYSWVRSIRDGDCDVVDVSGWNRGQVGDGTCSGNLRLNGPLATYSSVSGTYESYGPSEHTCSNHAGWDTEDVQVVGWSGLDAGVVG